jgi:phage shock protein C
MSDEEFSRAKSRLLDALMAQDGAAQASPAVSAANALRRSLGDRWVAGVCGGIACATGVESWIWRLLFAALVLCGGTGVVLYLLLWIFVPVEAAASDPK